MSTRNTSNTIDFTVYLKPYGIYKPEEKCLYLKDNKYLQDENLLKILKMYNIKIQLDLFT